MVPAFRRDDNQELISRPSNTHEGSPEVPRPETIYKKLILNIYLFVFIAIASPVHAKINVVATIKPIHSLVAGVMQGVGEPDLLLETGSPHNYALKPSNARALQSADLIVWIGPQIETFLRGPMNSLANKATILTLSNTPELTMHKVRSNIHKHENIDPHIWLDPLNAKAFVSTITKALAKLDSKNAAKYILNAAKISARLSKLNDKIKRQLRPVKNKPFLTFHDAYQYFEKRYQLNMRGSLALSPARQPGVRHLRELKKRIIKLGIGCVFAEPQFRPKLIDIVIEGTSAQSAILDPLGANIEKGPELYFSLLKENARAVLLCLE